MKYAIIKMMVVSAAVVIAANVSQAQFSANFQTNTVDGGSVVWNGTYCVGSNTSFNVLQVLNSGTLTNGEGNLGYTATSSNNLALVSGVGSIWTNATDMNVGYNGSGNRLVITNGGLVVSSNGLIGRAYGTTMNQLEVTGSGSVWQCTKQLTIGNSGNGNQMTISSGGRVVNSDYGTVGNYGNGNKAVVTGPGSRWESPADLYLGKGIKYHNNELVITNVGCVVNKNAFIGGELGSTNNTVMITGVGSVWTNTSSVTVGNSGDRNQVTVKDGGRILTVNLSVGANAGANSNRLVISGTGSLCKATGSSYLGSSGIGNSVVVTNGGMLWDYIAHVGNVSNYNEVIVSGAGSVWTNTSSISVGRAGVGSRVTVSDGGAVYTVTLTVGVLPNTTNHQVVIGSRCLLEANTLIVTNAGNSIVNNGGIYQFSSATPTITTNGLAGVSPIVLTNGIISFRGLANAPLMAGTQLTRIDYQGDNGYRLNSATNATVATYTFDAVANTANPANYQSLYLTGVNPRWQGTALTIGSGGALRVDDTQASVGAVSTNNGTLNIANATVTFTSAATLNGTVVVDLDHLVSTNGAVFNTALTLGAASVIQLTTAGAYTNEQPVVLFRYTGTRSGIFASQIGVPSGYAINYGPETDGKIRLILTKGTLISVR